MGAALQPDIGGVAPVDAAAPAPPAQQSKSDAARAEYPPAPPPSGQYPPPASEAPPPTYGQPSYGRPVYGHCPPGAAYVSAPEPIPGFPIRAPLVSPLAGQVIVGCVHMHGSIVRSTTALRRPLTDLFCQTCLLADCRAAPRLGRLRSLTAPLAHACQIPSRRASQRRVLF